MDAEQQNEGVFQFLQNNRTTVLSESHFAQLKDIATTLILDNSAEIDRLQFIYECSTNASVLARLASPTLVEMSRAVRGDFNGLVPPSREEVLTAAAYCELAIDVMDGRTIPPQQNIVGNIIACIYVAGFTDVALPLLEKLGRSHYVPPILSSADTFSQSTFKNSPA